MLKRAVKELNKEVPLDFETYKTKGDFEIKPGLFQKKLENVHIIHLLMP